MSSLIDILSLTMEKQWKKALWFAKVITELMFICGVKVSLENGYGY